MESFASAIQKVIEKIADFFDIFDLSFFLAGGVAFVGIWRLGVRFADVAALPASGEIGASRFLGLLIAAYVAGLICFALGRTARRKKTDIWGQGDDEQALSLEQVVLRHAIQHDLYKVERFQPYFQAEEPGGPPTGTFTVVYTRWWAELRERPNLAASFALVRRYWILAAVFDGLSFAVLPWSVEAAVVGTELFMDMAPLLPGAAAAGIVAVVVAILTWSLMKVMWGEANRLGQYQLEELAATMATNEDLKPA